MDLIGEVQEKEQIVWKKVKLVFQPDVRKLCYKKYHNHPRGCPNFAKKQGCPPEAPLITEVIDINKLTYVIFNKFDVGTHADRMKKLHPNWTIRQMYNCLYWQGKARKQLKEEIFRFMAEYPDFLIVRSPEAAGVNLTATMKSIGIELDWPPRKWAYQISVAGLKVLK